MSDTRVKILRESLALFNRLGVDKVSTNHIAKSLEMSPGNFYYHFANKEEIIRELFDQMTKKIDALWAFEVPAPPKPFFQASMQVFWEFRFFHREMYALRRNDRVLSKRWHAHLDRSLITLKNILESWSERKIIREATSEAPSKLNDTNDLCSLIIITAGAYLQFYESTERRASSRTIDQGVNALMKVLQPYLLPSSK